MAAFMVGDIVRVGLPRGYNKRGIYGISVLYTTSMEARFDGAVGRVTQINPRGSHGIPLYLVDFRGHDNSRLGIPWQAQWFREEWLTLVERPSTEAASANGSRDTAGETAVAPAASRTASARA